MNINCIHKCKYQAEGKCTLTKLPQDYRLYNLGKKSDCPYIVEEINRIIK